MIACIYIIATIIVSYCVVRALISGAAVECPAPPRPAPPRPAPPRPAPPRPAPPRPTRIASIVRSEGHPVLFSFISNCKIRILLISRFSFEIS